MYGKSVGCASLADSGALLSSDWGLYCYKTQGTAFVFSENCWIFGFHVRYPWTAWEAVIGVPAFLRAVKVGGCGGGGGGAAAHAALHTKELGAVGRGRAYHQKLSGARFWRQSKGAPGRHGIYDGGHGKGAGMAPAAPAHRASPITVQPGTFSDSVLPARKIEFES